MLREDLLNRRVVQVAGVNDDEHAAALDGLTVVLGLFVRVARARQSRRDEARRAADNRTSNRTAADCAQSRRQQRARRDEGANARDKSRRDAEHRADAHARECAFGDVATRIVMVLARAAARSVGGLLRDDREVLLAHALSADSIYCRFRLSAGVK